MLLLLQSVWLRRYTQGVAALCPRLIGVSLSGYCLADDNKTFSCVVLKDKNTFAGTLYKNQDKPLEEYGVLKYPYSSRGLSCFFFTQAEYFIYARNYSDASSMDSLWPFRAENGANCAARMCIDIGGCFSDT